MKRNLLWGIFGAALLAVSLAAWGGSGPSANRAALRDVMLTRAYNACLAAAANSNFGTLSTHRADWPRGYRDCAVVMRAEDRRGREAARKSWEHWYARHAEQRAVIREAVALLGAHHIDWRSFNRSAAADARSAAKQ